MSRNKSAFTLVELLVVIGIIAVLISILLPSLNKARKSAENIKCMSNLRQIGIGMHAYAANNGGRLPPMHIGFKPDQLRTKGLNNYNPPPPGGPNPDGDVRPVLKEYVDYNLLQCPIPQKMNLDQLPGADTIESSYAFYADFRFTDGPAGSPNKPFSHVNGYFEWQDAGQVHLFDVLAGDLDVDATGLGFAGWETSHPTDNSGPEYYDSPSFTLSRFSHANVGTPRAKMTRNLLYNDGSVISYANERYDYKGSSDWVRVPAFDSKGFGIWTYLTKKGVR